MVKLNGAWLRICLDRKLRTLLFQWKPKEDSSEVGELQAFGREEGLSGEVLDAEGLSGGILIFCGVQGLA